MSDQLYLNLINRIHLGAKALTQRNLPDLCRTDPPSMCSTSNRRCVAGKRWSHIMRFNLKTVLLTGASVAFLTLAGGAVTSSPAQAGPLAVAPKQAIAAGSLVESVQYRRGARPARVGVRRSGVRHARHHHGGRRYVHRRAYRGASFFPAAVLGLFAGALGAATFGSSAYYCDPSYYTWNYNAGCNVGGYYPAYYPGYSTVYYDSYYPVYRRNVYPAYHTRPVVYRTRFQRPRTVHYRAVAPRRHFIGSRTHVRAGYTVRRGRR
jgi:hypothetical protein